MIMHQIQATDSILTWIDSIMKGASLFFKTFKSIDTWLRQQRKIKHYGNIVTRTTISVDFLEDSAFKCLLEHMNPLHVFHLHLVVDSRHHQVPHDHLILEVNGQDVSEFPRFEEVLVVLEIDAWFPLDSFNDLETVELVICEVRLDVIEKRRPEARQKVLCGIRFLLPLLLFLLFEVFSHLFFILKNILCEGWGFLRICGLDLQFCNFFTGLCLLSWYNRRSVKLSELFCCFHNRNWQGRLSLLDVNVSRL